MKNFEEFFLNESKTESIKYREHRGSLKESEKTEKTFNDLKELKEHLNDIYGDNIKDIKFQHVGMDDRTGWDTYYVTACFGDCDNYSVVGMSDGKF